MEEQQQYQQPVQSILPKLPNDPLSLIMGILSIPFCCCYGIGPIFAAIGLFTANKAMKEYEANPGAFSEKSYSNMKTAKIVSIIGLVIGLLYLALFVYQIATIGWSGIQEQQREMMERWGQ